ncbi:MAG TPA: excinuclease ABC subunit UvrA, partial [Gemmatimonadaceae bacterium]|nr:excinuclease ABC subunit UvrA [Gemmatimonadaceae bacterium]
DSIDGLPPAVALQQQRGSPSVRSSVGSVTTISNLLRMLYSRAGHYPRGQPMLYAEDFSTNTPQGACPGCHGLGTVYDVTESSMVPDDTLTIRERAVAAWPTAWQGQNLRDILVTLGHDVDVPWRDLPMRTRRWILFTEEQPTVPVYAGFTPAETRTALKRKLEPSYMGTFVGARKYVLDTFATTQSALMKKRVSRFMLGTRCPTCDGRRLKQEALSVTFAGMDIGTLSQLSFDGLADALRPTARGEWPRPAAATRQPKRAVQALDAERSAAHVAAGNVLRTPEDSEEKRIAAERIARDVLTRVETLQSLGLGYLALERTTTTLSAGELQRLRLATQIRSNLFGVVYVLDEPSAGLHPADNDALFVALDNLKAAGNTVFVVEHDLEIMRRADWLVDVGPDGGTGGGQIVYSGPPAGLAGVATSRTAPYLFADVAPLAHTRRQPQRWLELRDVTRNTLHHLAVRVPLQCLTMVTGISGSGKSSLVSQALVDIVADHLGHEPVDIAADEHDEPGVELRTRGHIVTGGDGIRRLVKVDQRPIGRTPRSNLATYTGLFDHVRRLFAGTKAARARRYDAGRFSFNMVPGRCETCEGEGFVSVELLFMATVYAPCPTCHGARYNPQTLTVTWRERSIAQVLQLTVDEAQGFFEGETAIVRPLTLLSGIGLGYLRLGQPATELSGGEAQRIKLVTELQRAQRRDTLYVLDEPSTGLHPADVDRLMTQLQGLVDGGNTVVVVEHDMRVVAAADWIIDMGPGAGTDGGRIVAEGPPESLLAAAGNRTARYLKRWIMAPDATGTRTGPGSLQ